MRASAGGCGCSPEKKSSVAAVRAPPMGKICDPSTQICGNKFHIQLYKVHPFPPFIDIHGQIKCKV